MNVFNPWELSVLGVAFFLWTFGAYLNLGRDHYPIAFIMKVQKVSSEEIAAGIHS